MTNFNKEATKFHRFPKSEALLHFSSPHLCPLMCPSVPSVNEKWVGTCPHVPYGSGAMDLDLPTDRWDKAWHSLYDNRHIAVIMTRSTRQLGIQRVQADISRSRYVAIATQPVHRLQIRPTMHN